MSGGETLFLFFLVFFLCRIAFPGILFLTAPEANASALTNKYQRILLFCVGFFFSNSFSCMILLVCVT